MRISSWLLCPAFALATACGKAGDKAAEAPGDTMAASAPSGPKAIVTVLYNPPKDTAAFERYYAGTHLPLVVANQKEVGFTRADLTKFVSTADGKKPTYYRQAELYFNSMEDLQKGIATPGFKKIADDLANFASGGLTGMIAQASNPHEQSSTSAPGAIATVIYKTPKDTAAFEKYYADKHIPLVVATQEQIGFERAELTKFDANLDGSKPARYRQAELYFPSMDALKKGTATPAFKEVVGDLSKFATGGFDALVGAETK
ncbi:MAG TPA: EthD family reductase [Gemmatimonadales bacterium]|nr:EthD family reductase [Gemmatimonadales bacterium]